MGQDLMKDEHQSLVSFISFELPACFMQRLQYFGRFSLPAVYLDWP